MVSIKKRSKNRKIQKARKARKSKKSRKSRIIGNKFGSNDLICDRCRTRINDKCFYYCASCGSAYHCNCINGLEYDDVITKCYICPCGNLLIKNK